MTIGLHKRRLPSIALLVSLATGLFWGWFVLCHITEVEQAIDILPIIGGLLFVSGPFLVSAWLLWYKPVAGSITLIAIGVVMAALEFWVLGQRSGTTDWVTAALLAGLPILLGAFNLYRVKSSNPKS